VSLARYERGLSVSLGSSNGLGGRGGHLPQGPRGRQRVLDERPAKSESVGSCLKRVAKGNSLRDILSQVLRIQVLYTIKSCAGAIDEGG
jgi:hypothetical protein